MNQRDDEADIHVTENVCQNRFNSTDTNPAPPPCPTIRSVGIRQEDAAESQIYSSEKRNPTSTHAASTETIATPTPTRALNRCSGCRRKVGLTGFRCRCGEMFCGEHRYSDRHDCSFDYKAAGRESIARSNPVIRASKIVRI